MSDIRDFLNVYQSLKFQDDPAKPSDSGDVKRKIIAFQSGMSQHPLSKNPAHDLLLENTLAEYSSLVDCTDTTQGLNNFAEGALTFSSQFKNESKQWKSSLTAITTEADEGQKLPTLPQDEDSTWLSEIFKDTPDSIADKTSEMKSSVVRYEARSLQPRMVREHLPKFGCLPQKTPGSSRYNPSASLLDDKMKPRSSVESHNIAPHVQNQLPYRNPNFNCNKQKVDVEEPPMGGPAFRTARDQMIIEKRKKLGRQGDGDQVTSDLYRGNTRKSLGTCRGPSSKFVPPVRSSSSSSFWNDPTRDTSRPESEADAFLQNIDPKLVEIVLNEIMYSGTPVSWDQIAGLEFAKKTIKEIVIWPMLRPDIFTGLRGMPKGILLFGPPGTGKTLIGKCIASQSNSVFFNISASSLTSKWIGEGEKMVRTLFAVARSKQPSVIFIDEIDSLLTQRSDTEHESSRRLKTEFLVQLDGAGTDQNERILIVGATNRPQELDEAARRRLVKRLYIPLPEMSARRQIVESLMSTEDHSLSTQEVEQICQVTEGYSGADMSNLCREAALGPIRNICGDEIQHISMDQVRPIVYQDFIAALDQVRASVSDQDLDIYIEWNKKFGCGGT